MDRWTNAGKNNLRGGSKYSEIIYTVENQQTCTSCQNPPFNTTQNLFVFNAKNRPVL